MVQTDSNPGLSDPKPALLSTAPTARQGERRRRESKGRKGNLDKDRGDTRICPEGRVCAGAGGEARQAGRQPLKPAAVRPKWARVVSGSGEDNVSGKIHLAVE